MIAWTFLSLSLSLSWVRPAAACGPYFPTPMLLRHDDDLWSAPIAGFVSEIQALYPPSAAAPAPVARETLDADLADLQAAMGAAAPVEALRAFRSRTHPGPYASPLPVTAADVPPGLPPEFDHYLHGAVAWHSGDVEGAIARWKAVLALPPEQRQHRSVWAAYMLGRAQDVSWMAQVRALAAEGFSDSLGLAQASRGWQAHHLLWQQQAHAQAAALYIQQVRDQDPTAPQSLRIVADHLLEEGDLRAAAQDPELVRIVTLRLLSASSHPRAALWLEAVEQAGTAPLVGAEHLAWASYQAGDMDRAQRWLQQAPPSAMARWIAARLAMRDGNLEDAQRLLEDAAALLGPDTTWDASWRSDEYSPLYPSHQALAERGAVLVKAGRYTEALDAFQRADHWLDVAYLAERILTLEELRAYVDTLPQDDDSRELRTLLARRILREGDPHDALPYFEEEAGLRQTAQRYADARTRAASRASSRLERATALWEAARIARWDGMEILGTELAPDFAYTDGYYDGPAVALFRLGEDMAPNQYAPSDDEKARAARAALPEKRFHYRYLAADLAWQAADLLPDDDTGTLKVLCQAGSWLKDRDPAAADPFYKAMVNRGWNNDLGDHANKQRWFPDAASCAMDDLTLDHPEAVRDPGCATAPAPRGAQPLLAILGMALWRRRQRQ